MTTDGDSITKTLSCSIRGASFARDLDEHLLSCIRREIWKRPDRSGVEFESFGAYALHEEPEGLGITLDHVVVLRNALLRAKALREWHSLMRLLVRKPGRPKKLADGANFNDFFYDLPTGSNCIDRLLIRLHRDRSELFERVCQHDISVRGAAIEAGWIPAKEHSFVFSYDPKAQIVTMMDLIPSGDDLWQIAICIWEELTCEEQQRFRDFISAVHPMSPSGEAG